MHLGFGFVSDFFILKGAGSCGGCLRMSVVGGGSCGGGVVFLVFFILCIYWIAQSKI